MPPIRVLHVVGSMKRGGIETWLMSMLRHVDRERFQFDFLVSNRSQSPLEKEIYDLGSKIHVCMAHSQPLRYAFNLARILRTQGPYDIVHSHLHHLNGMVSVIAGLSGVPVRIAHSHFAISGTAAEAAGFNGARYRVARSLVRSFATGALGCSALAGSALFGPDWERELNRRVLFCGIDLDRFRVKPDRNAIRAALGIPVDSVVIGHAGRFVPQKNHSFFVEVAQAYSALDPRAHFLLLGDGPVWADTKKLAAASPAGSRFHFVGPRDDVPDLMLAAMDCFLFPSHFEGLPLVLVEAQAAGLPCVISDVIASETDICPDLLRRMSLKQSAHEWARTMHDAIAESTAEKKAAAFRALEASPFNISRAWEELEKYYLQLSGIPYDSREIREQAAAI
jgi:glycosyltransferase involved in cell wall biosynthesis